MTNKRSIQALDMPQRGRIPAGSELFGKTDEISTISGCTANAAFGTGKCSLGVFP